MKGRTHFWLRAEQKAGEQRTLLHPEHVQRLLGAGHQVTVERCSQRCIKNEEYEKISAPGFSMAQTGSWVRAPKDAVISGLKELDDGNVRTPLHHRHIYFAHCFKGQTGSEDLLKRYKAGAGSLYDLEFLTHENGTRVAAFSNAAGKVGAALGIEAWARQHGGDGVPKVPSLPAQTSTYETYEALNDAVRPLLSSALKKKDLGDLKVLVIGALGRSGKGAVEVAKALDTNVTEWDMAETARGGPFPELLDYDVVVNCIYLNPSGPKQVPFLTSEMIAKANATRRLSVVVDVSCDPNNINNPLPIYDKITDLYRPTYLVQGPPHPLEVIAIDHLPSLVPRASSAEFANLLMPHLEAFDETPVWQRALKLFQSKIDSL